ncbi:hypothetical protein ACIBEJ_23625 [Nonomuraea sp. NPDC050790]|uniref:hypothetical protein n=1 Tax=Nonomuraea sp. NPDC050790 TaxID=3364371 RepID=UPI0037AEB132
MVGGPGELAVTTTYEAEQHIRTLTGGGDTLWRNSVAPRAFIPMMRYRPDRDAVRLTQPLLVCIATEDHETPGEKTRALAARRGPRVPGHPLQLLHRRRDPRPGGRRPDRLPPPSPAVGASRAVNR